MRRILGMAVLATAALIAGCSDSKGGGSVSTVTFLGSSSSQASSPSTTLAATTIVGATPTTLAVAATTTSTVPVTTVVTASPDLTAVLPSNISPPPTVRDSSSSPDDPKIFETYKASWDGYVWTASHPDDPRWDWIDKTIEPSNRKAWRRDIEDHWAKGQILNADLGVTVYPHVYDRNPRRTYLYDCRTSGLYWVDSSTGLPAAGEVSQQRLEAWYVSMALVDGTWYTAAASVDSTQRKVAECGA